MSTDRWVKKRLASLESAPGWQTDAPAALSRLRQRDCAYRARKRRWSWIAAAAWVASVFAFAVPGCCDTPGSHSCGQPLAGRLWREVFSQPVDEKLPTEAVNAPQNQAFSTPAHRREAGSQTSAQASFKELGSPAAPITCEIYTDYQCPFCAVLYRDTIPRLVADYVKSGKVKLVHRDFPLPQHPYGRLAARYANAAGRLGQYDLVVNLLFQTQSQWSGDGNIDRLLSELLAPASMLQVRAMVRMTPPWMTRLRAMSPWPRGLNPSDSHP
jgi:Thioredoxin